MVLISEAPGVPEAVSARSHGPAFDSALELALG